MPKTQQSLFNFENTNENLKYKALQEVKNVCNYCYKCDLSKTRTNVVFGEGNCTSKISSSNSHDCSLPKLMLIGEGPGQNEDETGRPFVGKAGKLLDKILESQDISREKNLYICNIVKCRPPENRAPLNEEMAACRIYLDAQIQLIRPKIIILCGTTAVKAILKVKTGISKIRGEWIEGPFNSKMMPIFHPSYLLRNRSQAVDTPQWLTLEDIKKIKKELDLLN